MTLTPRQLADLRRQPLGEAGNKVRAARLLAKWKQTALAAVLGLSQTYVSDVERGRNQTVTVALAHRFAEAFGCQIEDLFPDKSSHGPQQRRQAATTPPRQTLRSQDRLEGRSQFRGLVIAGRDLVTTPAAVRGRK